MIVTEPIESVSLTDLTELADTPSQEERDTTLKDLIMMVQNGVSVADAAEELGIPAVTAYVQLKGSNILAGLKEVRDKAVVDAYRSGAPLHDIVRQLGVSQATIYTILYKYDVPRRRRSPRPITDEERRTIIELYQAGESVMGIVAKTQRYLPQIYQVLHNANIKLRRG